MPTFDIVNKFNLESFKNAIEAVKREIANRYDFKGSRSEITEKDKIYYILADSEMKLNQIKEILLRNMVRQVMDAKSIKFEKIEKASGNMLKQQIQLIEGIDKEISQKIIKMVKGTKKKVQLSIQGDQIRASGKKRDELQDIISLIEKEEYPIPLKFINFRD